MEVLNKPQLEILRMSDIDVDNLYRRYMNSSISEDDIKAVVKYCRYESVIDNVLYGNGYTLPLKRWNSINDDRVDKNTIITDEFTKEVTRIDKKTNEQVVEYIPYIRVISGYSNPDIDLYKFIRDIYTGKNKDNIISAVKALDKAKSDLESAKSDWLDNNDSRKESKLSKTMKAAKKEYDKALSKYNESVPKDTQDSYESYIKDLKDMMRDRHMDKQICLKNRMAVLRTALNQHKAKIAQERLHNKREKSKSLNELYRHLTNE